MAQSTKDRPELLADSIREKLTTLANTGDYETAVLAIKDMCRKSKAIKDYCDVYDLSDEQRLHKQAAGAVFFFRVRKYDAQKRIDPWPAGKLNTEFAMFCSGKTKEEIEKLYLEFSEKTKQK